MTLSPSGPPSSASAGSNELATGRVASASLRTYGRLARMTSHSIGWGGIDYTYGTLQLDGTLSGHGCFVVGGPTASQMNYSPAFAQGDDLEPDLQNPDGGDGDGIALFLGPAGEITPESVPLDAVVYGENNPNDLIDENGDVATPDVAAGNDMQTIARTDEGWVVNEAPSPNDCTTPM